MDKMIDLHIHSNFSDGVLSPKKIVDEAIRNNVNTIAISDHDTIDAYTEELYEYAKLGGVKIINGVEISTKSEKSTIHVLGYNFDISNKELKEKLDGLRNARHKYLHDVAEKLNELGYIVNVEKLDKIESVTKSNISLDIINNSANEEKLIHTFGYIPSKGEFIEKMMNKGCPAYVKKETMTPKEAVELIKKAGGKAVLAHPVAYKYQSKLQEEDIISLIDEIKPDGIEANYIYYNSNNIKINEIEKWNKVAKERKLFTTVGSDFHMKDGIRPEIGFVNQDFKLNTEMINNIISNILD